MMACVAMRASINDDGTIHGGPRVRQAGGRGKVGGAYAQAGPTYHITAPHTSPSSLSSMHTRLNQGAKDRITFPIYALFEHDILVRTGIHTVLEACR